MKNLFRPCSLICTLALLQVFVIVVRACTCTEYGTPPCARFWRSKIVFVGRVVAIGQPPTNDGRDAGATVHLSVEEVFRGVISGEAFDLQTNGADCGLKYEKGKLYLLYVYDFDPTTRRIKTSYCNRSRELSGAGEDLEYIRSLADKDVKPSVRGRALMNSSDPLKDVKITVAGNGRQYETVTDHQGRYEIALTRAGSYQVRAVLPFSALALSYTPDIRQKPAEEQTTLEYEVKLSPGQCDYRELDLIKIDMKATAEVSGKVIDHLGAPVAKLTVYLYPATAEQGFTTGDYKFAETDAEGNYKFTGLRGGRFWIGVNLGRMPGLDSPYPTTFYPGVASREQAGVVTVNESEPVSVLAFRLPPKLVEREVTGFLVWPDGTPVTRFSPDPSVKIGPNLKILDSQRLQSVWSRGRDGGRPSMQMYEEGRFSIVGFEGYTYVIGAHALDADKKPVHAKYMNVTFSEGMGPLKLVLSRPGAGEGKEEIRQELNERP